MRAARDAMRVGGAEKIAKGVFVFRPIEPADDDPALLLLTLQRSRIQFCVEKLGRGVNIPLRRPRPLL